MQFQTLEFLIFLLAVFGLYWCLSKHRKWQNFIILAASYIFYGWWDWSFLSLIIGTSTLSYLSGLFLQKLDIQGKTKACRAVSVANIVINIGVLGLFKYFDFFTKEFSELLQTFGIQADLPTLGLILPVGISFYTFQALSYSIDVYRKEIEPTRNIIEFFAYISFFPQLVAGPIERASNLLPQFQQPRKFDYALAADGGRQMLWGFFKKLVVADNCALYVNMVFADYTTQSAGTLWMAAFFFAIQIYGDFSGYSDIAIGTAKLFGFRLMQNFKTPYFSRDIAEFWRRWHISLTTWFRDYIYIPLGGSRVSKAKVILNTMIIFLVSGLWHGASFTFVAWGLYHALLFLPIILLGKNRKHIDIVAQGRMFPTLLELGQMSITFVLVIIGWVFFRADYMVNALGYLKQMFIGWDGRGLASYPESSGMVTLASILVMAIADWRSRNCNHAMQQLATRKTWFRWMVYTLLLAIIIFYFAIGYNSPSQFIYFQF